MADRVTRLTRGQLLAYRAVVSDLTVRRDDPVECTVLDTGVQDTPPGTTASRAVLMRVGPKAREVVRRLASDERLTVLHSLRGTMHLHRVADAGLLAAGLPPVDVDDVAVSQQGRYFIGLQRQGVTPGEALDDVASAMRLVMADGRLRTKGELSCAVTSLVDGRLPRWCAGCGVAHVHDGLFRYATLAAGLAVVPAVDGTRFRTLRPGVVVDRDQARRVLLRRFLRACGPSGPAQLAAWLGAATAAARRMWRVLEPELVAVWVAGAPVGWMHRDDVGTAVTASPPPRLRLLPAYDPLTEIADRDFVVPDPARRRRVWRASANPGVVLRHGEVAGVWRWRTVSRLLVVTVEPFGELSGTDLEDAVADAGVMADLAGLSGARVRLAA